jgi:hypothetical protein
LVAIVIDPHFRMLSPDSAHPRDVPIAIMIDEIARELAGRRKVYPQWIEIERITKLESAHEIGTVTAILADLRMSQSCWRRNGTPFAPDTSATSEAKVKVLRREISIRRASYPRWIDKGGLNVAVAHAQMERIEAIHWLYWADATFWLPDAALDEAATLAATHAFMHAFMHAHLPAYHAACDQRADTMES